jgi:hypothetical protein
MNPLDAETLLAADEIYAKIVTLARESKDDQKLALALHAQGHSFVLGGDLEAATKAFDESRELSARTGDKRRASLSSVMLGYVAIVGGKLEEGLPRIVAALGEIDAADSGRQVVLLRLLEVSKRFEKKRFDAALKAAVRELPAEVQTEIAKAVSA